MKAPPTAPPVHTIPVGVTSSGMTPDLPGDRVSILVVDDQPGKLLSHEAVLAELDQNIVKARSGREALEFLLKQDFAVILLDVNMPEMDGFETATLIRQRPRFEHTPILFITGYNTSDIDRLKGYDIGAADYLFLPVIPEVLKTKVRVFVELAKQKQIIQKQAEFLAFHNRQQQEQIHIIQDLNEKLRIANEELESFSYSVSHDLRSPLRAMQGYAEALMEELGGRLSFDGEGYLRRISKAALRMDALIQDILTYSRIAKMEIRTEAIDLEELLDQVVLESETVQRSKADLVIERPMPGVRGHEACLTQCISNLIENAVKFVPRGVVPRVKIRADYDKARVRIWIEDNGIGIDPVHHARIFQMFGRVHSEKEYDGTGVGLTIVKKAAERMGGTVGVESELGAGSRFWVELPQPAPANS